VICADGVLISGHNLRCDESSATGESDLIKKQAYADSNGICQDPFLVSGSKVSEGVGKYVVVAVGPYSYHGKTMMGKTWLLHVDACWNASSLVLMLQTKKGLRTSTEDTPLQLKLDRLAEVIAKLGAVVALLLLIILLLKYFIVQSVNGSWPSAAVIVMNVVDVSLLRVEADAPSLFPRPFSSHHGLLIVDFDSIGDGGRGRGPRRTALGSNTGASLRHYENAQGQQFGAGPRRM
jgi:magnesium-transporting ATPase (P-type)